jgi:surface carbohydrate biosynthesis protein (TIGR04326 family)
LNTALKKVLIWDTDSELQDENNIVFLWRTFTENAENCYSIPGHIEENSSTIRQKYLSFLYEISEDQSKGNNLIKRLAIDNGLSYWWMTLIAQKDVIQYSPHIYDIIKLFSLNEQIKSITFNEIEVHSDNSELISILKEWAEVKNIKYSAFNSKGRDVTSQKLIFKDLLLRSKIFVRGFFIFSKYTIQRIRPFRQTKISLPDNKFEISFFDILTHLNKISFETGEFSSGYWTKIVEFLRTQNISTNWFHLFFRHRSIKNIPNARRLIKAFNKKTASENHILLDAELSIFDVLKVLYYVCVINIASIRIRDLNKRFRDKESEFNFWHILKNDWYESFWGARAYLNLYNIVIFKSVLSKIPKQRLGIYIQENQPWEYALIHYWKSYGHKKIVSVAHTTIPFWDFRYFFDPRSFLETSTIPPLPDLVAVNGPDGLDKLRISGFPESKIICLEALRYMHLTFKEKNNPFEQKGIVHEINLLVIGDLVSEISKTQLLFLNEALKNSEIKLHIIFKPHPASLDLPDYLLKGLTISNNTMGEELLNCDIVFVNNVTSGAADPYQLGIPVIVLNIPNNINFSPLFSRDDVFFVNNKKEFINVIKNLNLNKERKMHAFFNTDENLTEWKKIIASA